jgi:hypothetical protein
MRRKKAAAFLRLGVVCGQLQDFTCATEAFQKAEGLYQALSNLEGVTEVFYERGFLFLNGDKLHERERSWKRRSNDEGHTEQIPTDQSDVNPKQRLRRRRPFDASGATGDSGYSISAGQRYRESSHKRPNLAWQFVSPSCEYSDAENITSRHLSSPKETNCV